MKTHAKKKAYRTMIQQLAKDGMINTPDGRMIKRDTSRNSMERDYYPQK